MQNREHETTGIAARIHELLAAATTDGLPAGPGPALDRAKELAAEVGAGRERR